MILDDLPTEAITALPAVVGPGVDTRLLAVDLRHLGGEVRRPDPRGGAVNHLPGRFLLYAVGITPTPDAVRGIEANIAALRKALALWSAAQDYLNFRDSTDDASKFYDQLTIDPVSRPFGPRTAQTRSSAPITLWRQRACQLCGAARATREHYRPSCKATISSSP